MRFQPDPCRLRVRTLSFVSSTPVRTVTRIQNIVPEVFHSLTQVLRSKTWIAPSDNFPPILHSISCYVHTSVTSQSLRTYEPNLVPRRTNVIFPRLSHITTRPLGRPRRRLEDNIKLDLQEVGWAGVDLIYLAQDRGRWWALVNAVMHLRVP